MTGLWRKVRGLFVRDRDEDGAEASSQSRADLLDAKIAALGNNPAPPGYIPKPDDGRPRH